MLGVWERSGVENVKQERVGVPGCVCGAPWTEVVDMGGLCGKNVQRSPQAECGLPDIDHTPPPQKQALAGGWVVFVTLCATKSCGRGVVTHCEPPRAHAAGRQKHIALAIGFCAVFCCIRFCAVFCWIRFCAVFGCISQRGLHPSIHGQARAPHR